MTEGLALKRCSICRKAFYPKREWAKTCSPECSKERNRQNSLATTRRKAALQKDKVEEIMQPLIAVEDDDVRAPGWKSLTAVILLFGYRENDVQFAKTDWCEFLCDGIDLNYERYRAKLLAESGNA
jgi:hypothetical protein